MIDIARHRNAIEEHILAMKASATVQEYQLGLNLFYMPTLHRMILILNSNLAPFAIDFFFAFDIVVASCRHMYHPFCIASLCSKKNRCVTCGELFNLGWWWCFAFKDLDVDL